MSIRIIRLEYYDIFTFLTSSNKHRIQSNHHKQSEMDSKHMKQALKN